MKHSTVGRTESQETRSTLDSMNAMGALPVAHLAGCASTMGA